MVHRSTSKPSGNSFSSNEGSPDNPYPLHWPASWYRRAGNGLGFDFTREEIQQAKQDSGVLGVARYEPTEDALVELRIPEGSYVKCYVH